MVCCIKFKLNYVYMLIFYVKREYIVNYVDVNW